MPRFFVCQWQRKMERTVGPAIWSKVSYTTWPKEKLNTQTSGPYVIVEHFKTMIINVLLLAASTLLVPLDVESDAGI